MLPAFRALDLADQDVDVRPVYQLYMATERLHQAHADVERIVEELWKGTNEFLEPLVDRAARSATNEDDEDADE